MNFFKKKPNYKPNSNDIQIPIITINNTGNILYSNNSANKLFDARNLQGSNVTDIIKADLPSIINGSNNSIRKSFQILGQNEKFVEITSKENPLEHYFILTFFEVSKDYILMNKLIDYRTNMDNLGKNKNIFLSQMSNVFKSPMHSIMGYSQAILEGMGGDIDEKQQKYLSIIYKHSEELFKIIDRVTELSTIEAQITNFTYKNFHISNLLNDIDSEYKSKAVNKGINFNIDTDNLSQKVVYGDESVLKKILSYLIENAFLACEFGTINVILSDKEYLEKGQNLLKIRIIDTSTPVKQTEMPYLFNPYYQPDKKNRIVLIRSLNLCIAGNLISQMNGKMSAETEISGFSIVIPTDKKVEKLKVE